MRQKPAKKTPSDLGLGELISDTGFGTGTLCQAKCSPAPQNRALAFPQPMINSLLLEGHACIRI